jgi:hypothetical protein
MASSGSDDRRMIRKSGHRFSDKIMRNQRPANYQRTFWLGTVKLVVTGGSGLRST